MYVFCVIWRQRKKILRNDNYIFLSFAFEMRKRLIFSLAYLFATNKINNPNRLDARNEYCCRWLPTFNSYMNLNKSIDCQSIFFHSIAMITIEFCINNIPNFIISLIHTVYSKIGIFSLREMALNSVVAHLFALHSFCLFTFFNLKHKSSIIILHYAYPLGTRPRHAQSMFEFNEGNMTWIKVPTCVLQFLFFKFLVFC